MADDIRHLILPLTSFVFIVNPQGYSSAHNNYEQYATPAFLTAAVLIFCGLLAGIIFNLARHKGRKNPTFRESGFWAMLILSVGVLFNGIFGTNPTVKNLLYALCFAIAGFGGYWMFSASLMRNERTVSYICFCFALSGMIVMAELVWKIRCGGITFTNGLVNRDSVVLGWGLCTSIGGFLAFLIPVYFKLASASPIGLLWYLLGCADLGFVLITQSRGAYLTAFVLLLFSLLLFWKKEVHLPFHRFLTVLTVLVILFALWKYRNWISACFWETDGIFKSDHGRFESWKIGWQKFKQDPLFGSGFYDTVIKEGWDANIAPMFYHNTLVQMAASCGIFGFSCYSAHRILTVIKFRKNHSAGNCYLFLALLGILIFSLADVMFFKLYPGVFYALLLLGTELDAPKTAKETAFS